MIVSMRAEPQIGGCEMEPLAGTKSERGYRRALASVERRRISDPQRFHREVRFLSGLGNVLLARGQFREAGLWLRRALRLAERSFGRSGESTVPALNNL